MKLYWNPAEGTTAKAQGTNAIAVEARGYFKACNLCENQYQVFWTIPVLGKCRGRAVKSTEFQTLLFLISRVWIRIPSHVLVSLSKTLTHCFVLQMGRKVVGSVCCVTHVKEPSAHRHLVSISFPFFSSTDQVSQVSVHQTEQRKCLQAVVVEALVTIKQAALTTLSTFCVQVRH